MKKGEPHGSVCIQPAGQGSRGRQDAAGVEGHHLRVYVPDGERPAADFLIPFSLHYPTEENRKRRLTFSEKKELEGMDDLLMNLETRLSEIDEEMGSTQDFEKLDELSKERDEVEKTLEEKNERYLELLEIEES